jgi:hypothetical protein
VTLPEMMALVQAKISDDITIKRQQRAVTINFFIFDSYYMVDYSL